jgi:hypothetical protein
MSVIELYRDSLWSITTLTSLSLVLYKNIKTAQAGLDKSNNIKNNQRHNHNFITYVIHFPGEGIRYRHYSFRILSSFFPFRVPLVN